jgi:hypothetical protein
MLNLHGYWTCSRKISNQNSPGNKYSVLIEDLLCMSTFTVHINVMTIKSVLALCFVGVLVVWALVFYLSSGIIPSLKIVALLKYEFIIIFKFIQ